MERIRVSDRLMQVFADAYTDAVAQRVAGVLERRRAGVEAVVNDVEFRAELAEILTAEQALRPVVIPARISVEMLTSPQMTLQQLFYRLRNDPRPDKILQYGLGNPHAWRNDYSVLAFEVIENQTIGEMRAVIERCFGEQFPCYKGGILEANGQTYVALGKYGESDGTELNRTTLEVMLSAVKGFVDLGRKIMPSIQAFKKAAESILPPGSTLEYGGMTHTIPASKLPPQGDLNLPLKEFPPSQLNPFPQRVEGFIDLPPVLPQEYDPSRSSGGDTPASPGDTPPSSPADSTQ